MHPVTDQGCRRTRRERPALGWARSLATRRHRRAADARGETYRDRALKIYPWICGRCAREFTRANLQELTVHHRNHDHDYNPPDGSNWELLCLYCHDNEHQRLIEASRNPTGGAKAAAAVGTDRPFAGLAGLLLKPSGKP